MRPGLEIDRPSVYLPSADRAASLLQSQSVGFLSSKGLEPSGLLSQNGDTECGLEFCHLLPDGKAGGLVTKAEGALNFEKEVLPYRSCPLEISAVVAVRAEGLKNKPSLRFHPGLQNALGTEMMLPCCIL